MLFVLPVWRCDDAVAGMHLVALESRLTDGMDRVSLLGQPRITLDRRLASLQIKLGRLIFLLTLKRLVLSSHAIIRLRAIL